MKHNQDEFEQGKKILLGVLNTIAEDCKKTNYCEDCIFDFEGACMFYEMAPTGWDLTWLKDNIEVKEG